jgi:hypothetical protein
VTRLTGWKLVRHVLLVAICVLHTLYIRDNATHHQFEIVKLSSYNLLITTVYNEVV